jgi:hypothetical protein
MDRLARIMDTYLSLASAERVATDTLFVNHQRINATERLEQVFGRDIRPGRPTGLQPVSEHFDVHSL